MTGFTDLIKSIPDSIQVLLVVVLTAGMGWLTVSRMPRLTASPEQAMILIGVSVVVGILGGWLHRSRWMMLIVPLVFILSLELGRPEIAGPSVGRLRLDETYGLLAFGLGRLIPGVISVLSILLGVRLGRILDRFLEQGSLFVGTDSSGSFLSLGILFVLVGGLAVLIALPGSTPEIVDQNGEKIPGSIASLEEVNLNGSKQTILIRAQNPDKPVLLYLSGGPGQSDLGFTRVLFEDLTDDFVVVSWDQRGVGKSYAAIDPTTELTLGQAVQDTVDLTNYLRERFEEDKIYLLGESYGSLLGVLTVQERPDLYYAWIGSGQMVDIAETDRRLYNRLLDYADQHDLPELKQQMLAYEEPPYQDIPYANGTVMGYYEALYEPYRPPQEYIDRGTSARLGPMNILSSEYSLIDRFNVLRGLVDMFSLLYPQLQEIDFRQDVTSLEVPIYILDGAAEVPARRDLTLEWYQMVQAPEKQIFTFENAAHSVAFEQFQELERILNEIILPATYPVELSN